MGNLVSLSSLVGNQPTPLKVLILGLDSAGKTTMLYRILPRHYEIVTTIPTIGFNVEQVFNVRQGFEFNANGFEFTSWDIGGGDKIRPLWRHYYQGSDAFVFVIDSSDRDRFSYVQKELQRIASEEALQNIPILIYCNKQDLHTAMSPTEIQENLFFDDPPFSNRPIILVGCSGLTGQGVRPGLMMLTAEIEKQKNMAKISTSDAEDSTVQQVSKGTTLKLDYNPIEGNLTLDRFLPIKNGSQCPFARAAQLWGGRPNPHNNNSSSIEVQAASNLPALMEFTRRSNWGKPLDGFCMELDHPDATSESVEKLGDCVRRALTALADGDDSWDQINKMRVNHIGSHGWRFRFHNENFFVSTFAPCYPVTSSRYAFGTGRAFLLFQPEQSFARHHVSADTPLTNWDEPETIRDETRVAFRNAGRPYFIADTTNNNPMAEKIVKPFTDDGVTKVRWWEPLS